MPCTEAYKEHIMYTFNGFCKPAIRYAALNACRHIDRQTQERIERLIESMKQAQGITTAKDGKRLRMGQKDE